MNTNKNVNVRKNMNHIINIFELIFGYFYIECVDTTIFIPFNLKTYYSISNYILW